MKPLIGINLDVEPGSPEQVHLNATYLHAIQSAGGIPLPIVPMPDEDLADMLEAISGLILIGGKDYNPDLYGCVAHEKTDTAHPWRQDFDMRLASRALFQSDLAILGICAGHQLINIVLGGTLFQDIETELPSSTKVDHGAADEQSCDFKRHQIEFAGPSRLKSLYNRKFIDVPSLHHQAINSLGTGLQVSSRADDGVIESIELPDRHFTIGVQWHPERDYSGNCVLFNAFLSAASAVTPTAQLQHPGSW